MTKTVDYYLFLLSPWAYLGSKRFNDVITKHHAKVNYKPRLCDKSLIGGSEATITKARMELLRFPGYCS